MKKSEKNALLKWARSLTDDELEKGYYNSVLDSLGSQTEEMYERGYDIVDIIEREKFEKYLLKKSRILEMICLERGIELWREEADNERN